MIYDKGSKMGMGNSGKELYAAEYKTASGISESAETQHLRLAVDGNTNILK
jgi:hypothetical protein